MPGPAATRYAGLPGTWSSGPGQPLWWRRQGGGCGRGTGAGADPVPRRVDVVARAGGEWRRVAVKLVTVGAEAAGVRRLDECDGRARPCSRMATAGWRV